MLNQPPQMQVSFKPLDNFFPVTQCISVTAQASELGLFFGGMLS
jgi:hypothetical protein